MSGRARRSIGGAAVAAVVALAGSGPGAAAPAGPSVVAAVSAVAETCQVTIGSINASGDHHARLVRSTTPPTGFSPMLVMRDVHPDGATVMAARANPYPSADPFRTQVFQWVVLGDALYHARYETTDDATLDPGQPELTRIGGGWSAMRAMEVSGYAYEPAATAKLYALGKDGVLYRWNRAGAGWTSRQTASGFSAVKAMTLVRHDSDADTFLMTTWGGALYSVRIPFTSFAPEVRVVRTRTWQLFETLVSQPCGRSGSVLAGIDRSTGDTYLYAVGAPNGTSTVIQGLGKANGSSTEPVLFTWAPSPVGF